MKCNETQGKWCINKHGASKIIDTFETYQPLPQSVAPELHEKESLGGITKVQKPVYFVSTVLRDAREHYTMQQKLLFTLLITSRKLHHYF
jgi:hypothetical protein